MHKNWNVLLYFSKYPFFLPTEVIRKVHHLLPNPKQAGSIHFLLELADCE